MGEPARSCWCGSPDLHVFGEEYLRCGSCATLVGQAGLTDGETKVVDDESDFYGKRYWLEHQRDELGLPDIYARSRQDLPERCVHWLKVVLRYRNPPARVLELGAGHGAFTALLRWAGFDATALDLSPWVAEFARERFGIPYLVGPIEKQHIEPRSLDVIVANDLVEHLPDPAATLRTCAELLADDGLILIQTPEWVPDRHYRDLVADDDPFLEHMRRARMEHLYLYSRGALVSLLDRSGLGETSFEEPPYPYDMVCVASPRSLSKSALDFESQLAPSPNGLLVLALVDAHDAWLKSENDRADRLRALETLDSSLRESEADRAARLELIEQLEKTLEEVETDRAARLNAVERLERALTESEADRAARLVVINRLQSALVESETGARHSPE